MPNVSNTDGLVSNNTVKHKWKDEWLAIGTNKLRSLKSSVDVWPSSCDRDRKVSCILTRLRIGHTRLTHQHLMKNRPPPYCTDCTVLHTVLIVLYSILYWLLSSPDCAALSCWVPLICGCADIPSNHRTRCGPDSADDALWESWGRFLILAG